MRSRLAVWLFVGLLLLVTSACDKLNSVTTSVSGNIYNQGSPVGGHITLIDFESGTTAYSGQTQTGHFIIQGVKAGEYVIRYMDMRAIPIGGGMYLQVSPGRPVTELKFEVWDIVPPTKKDKEGNLVMTEDQFKEKFGLMSKADAGIQ